ncbi:MAG TPA: cytochrome c3 family protein [Geothrix sp.]|nr:cytochrome c3 family protein [Geothrix sp.]
MSFPRVMLSRIRVLARFVALAAIPLLTPPLSAQPPELQPKVNQAPKSHGDAAAPEGYQVPKPPFTEGIFPCSSCHEGMPPNTKRRQLTDMHTDIVLNHGPESRWCLDCHDATKRDQLHLASGTPVRFTESYKLCGQCHGDKYRDWRVGVHGKRTGNWNGAKQYLLCVNCHNPHSPRFKPIQPMPAPLPPEKIFAHKGGAK